MNKELATVLKNKISGLPFIDVLAGLVQTVEADSYSDGDVKPITYKNRFPVSYDVVGAGDCIGREKDLQPDSSKKSITYFEDFGTQIVATRDGVTEFNSQVRLVCWLNRNRLVGDAYAEITAYCISAIIPLLCKPSPENIGMFTMLKTKARAVPEQGPGLFARYTYSETTRQYLRPPYEAFAIDLLVNYRVAGSCIQSINFNKEVTC